jgi:hypothetical protein
MDAGGIPIDVTVTMHPRCDQVVDVVTIPMMP